MEEYLLHDFWIYEDDGKYYSVRRHYQHFDDNLTLPETYVRTDYVRDKDSNEIHTCSKIISKNEYREALSRALKGGL